MTEALKKLIERKGFYPTGEEYRGEPVYGYDKEKEAMAAVIKVLMQYVVNDAYFGESQEAQRILDQAEEIAKGVV